MNNDDDSLQDKSEIELLQNLNLGSYTLPEKRETKDNNFEIKINDFLSKIDNRIKKIKNQVANSFQFKPLIINLDIENSENSGNSSVFSLTNEANNTSFYEYNKEENNESISNDQKYLHFKWVNRDNEEYLLKMVKDETVHEAIIRLLEDYNDFEYDDIDCVYILIEKKTDLKSSNNKETKSNSSSSSIKKYPENAMALKVNITKNGNNNAPTNKNQKDEKKNNFEKKDEKKNKFEKKDEKKNKFEKYILDINNNEKLENLNINETTDIYFETKDNISKGDNAIRDKEIEKYNIFIMKQNDGSKQLLTFKATNNIKYFLCTDINIKISQLLDDLKNRYKSLKNKEIKCAKYNENQLDNNKYIFNYNFTSESIIYI